MVFAKLLCGVWLLRVPLPSHTNIATVCIQKFGRFWNLLVRHMLRRQLSELKPDGRQPAETNYELRERESDPNAAAVALQGGPGHSEVSKKKSISLYPATILGFAMVARGEIGFLISAVAESNGILGNEDADGSSEIFITVTWAILLCTFIGPIAVGLTVRRLKSLARAAGPGRRDVVGSWLVE
jgi:hypothetical protein